MFTICECINRFFSAFNSKKIVNFDFSALWNSASTKMVLCVCDFFWYLKALINCDYKIIKRRKRNTHRSSCRIGFFFLAKAANCLTDSREANKRTKKQQTNRVSKSDWNRTKLWWHTINYGQPNCWSKSLQQLIMCRWSFESVKIESEKQWNLFINLIGNTVFSIGSNGLIDWTKSNKCETNCKQWIYRRIITKSWSAFLCPLVLKFIIAVYWLFQWLSEKKNNSIKTANKR